VTEGTCGSCGLPVAAGDVFCGHCGQPMAASPEPANGMQARGPAPPGPGGARRPWPQSARAALPRPGRAAWPGGPAPGGVAVGPAAQAQYAGHRLTYDQVPEAPFDPLGNPRLLQQYLWHGVLYFLVYVAGAVVAGAVLLFLGAVGLGYGSAARVWTLLAIGIALLFGCVYWLVPMPALLSEWKFSVDDGAEAAAATFEHLAWAVKRHETPLDLMQVRRLRFGGGQSRDYLELRREIFTGYISCFGYGRDLYLGWTFWVRLSPLRYLLMGIMRIWQMLIQHGSQLHVSLRYDYARAMREAIHSVAREGIAVAVGQAPAQGAGTVGGTMGVTVSDVQG
jgi:hypothetical protein